MPRTRNNLLRQQLSFINDPDNGDGGSGTNEDQKPAEGQQAPDNSGDKGNSDDDSNNDDKGFKPITSQEELDRIVQKRLDREKAKYADYDDLTTKVADLTKANEKLTQDLAAAQQARAEAERGALVARVAESKNVPAKYLEGDTEEELLASADEFLAVLEARGPKKGHNPHTGTGKETPPESSTLTGRERARAARAANRKD